MIGASRWPQNPSHTQTAVTIGLGVVANVALILFLWNRGFLLYAAAWLCLLVVSLVCAVFGIRADRRRRSLYGPDSQEWKELEKRGRETGALIGKVAPWPIMIAILLYLRGYSHAVVAVAFAIAFAIAMTVLVVEGRRMRRRWPPIQSPDTQPHP